MVKPKWLIHKFKFPIALILNTDACVFALSRQTLDSLTELQNCYDE